MSYVDPTILAVLPELVVEVGAKVYDDAMG
jgi:hypothetical protein